ncbi:MAG: hypothetical protein JNG88_13750, partial [Phycisphaerales bacterium]|nr:hypothetical protein [Phycisphaerales bacterium]
SAMRKCDHDISRCNQIFDIQILCVDHDFAAALIAAALVNIRAGSYATASRWKSGDSISVTRRDGAMHSLVWVSRGQNAKRPWGPEQAAGAPDAVSGRDDEAAWASMTADGSAEWLRLSYSPPVKAIELRAFENCSPGAIRAIQLLDPSGANIGTVWPTTMPTSAAAMPSVWPIDAEREISEVLLDIDSQRIGGWNEIDACGLVDVSGSLSWAVGVTASSSYADRSATNENPETLTPHWSRFQISDFARRSGDSSLEYLVVGFGWPMIALRGSAMIADDSIRQTMAAQSRARSVEFGVPWIPVWPGIIVNSIAYGGTLFLLVWLLTRPRRIFIELMRVRGGRCIQCGYDLRFDFARGCSECGWLRSDVDQSAGNRSQA